MEFQMHIIGNPQRGSLHRLIPEIEKSCEIVFIPGVYISNLEDLDAGIVDIQLFSIRAGRQVLLTEVGASLAHLESCKALLSTTKEWAIVLEDDAEIVDLAALIARVRQCINAYEGDFPAVISLYSRRVRDSGKGEELVEGVNFIPVSIGFTVAYLINRSGAQKVLDAQRPITSTADWPVDPPNINFAIDTAGTVDHLPPESRQSSISPSGEQRTGSRWTRIQIWSFIWFIRNRKAYAGFDDYRSRTLNRRLFYHAYVLPWEDKSPLPGSVLAQWLSQRLWIGFRGAPKNTHIRVD